MNMVVNFDKVSDQNIAVSAATWNLTTEEHGGAVGTASVKRFSRLSTLPLIKMSCVSLGPSLCAVEEQRV